jgi:hypothetical protein
MFPECSLQAALAGRSDTLQAGDVYWPLLLFLVGPPEESPIAAALTPATWPEVLVRWIIKNLDSKGVHADHLDHGKCTFLHLFARNVPRGGQGGALLGRGSGAEYSLHAECSPIVP